MGDGAFKANVEPWMMMAVAEGARERVVPEMVMGWLPGRRVWEAMM